VMNSVYKFFLNKWYFDEFYQRAFIQGTDAVAAAYRWFDNVIIDGLVNGIATWTVGLTHGVKRTWEEGKAGSIFYLVVFASLSIFIGWQAAIGLLAGSQSLGVMTECGFIGLGVAAISFFLFYVGVGGFDNKIIDGMVNLFASLAGFLGLLARRLQTGKVQTYLAFALFGILVFFLWFR